MKRLKTSRLFYLSNYMLAFLLLIFLFLANAVIVTLPVIIDYFIIFSIIAIVLQVEANIIYRSYVLGPDKISKITGIVLKREDTIPYSFVAYTELKKGLFGRLLNFGNITIVSAAGEQNKIEMLGIRKPERVLHRIEKKMKKSRRL